jgi:hypothetical protein
VPYAENAQLDKNAGRRIFRQEPSVTLCGVFETVYGSEGSLESFFYDIQGKTTGYIPAPQQS